VQRSQTIPERSQRSPRSSKSESTSLIRAIACSPVESRESNACRIGRTAPAPRRGPSVRGRGTTAANTGVAGAPDEIVGAWIILSTR